MLSLLILPTKKNERSDTMINIPMQHSIADMAKKISVMYDKSLLLYRLRYDTPIDRQDERLINALIADIQALAGDIYNDRESQNTLT